MHAFLCDLIADLVQNAAESGASRILLECVQERNRLSVRVADNGGGMTAECLNHASDPFYTDGRKHPGRRVHFGLPFLYQTADQTHGFCSVESEKKKGTVVNADFDLTNIDLPPAGSFADLFQCALTFDGGYEMEIHRKNDAAALEYRLNRSELKSALGGELLSAAARLRLRRFLEALESGGPAEL